MKMTFKTLLFVIVMMKVEQRLLESSNGRFEIIIRIHKGKAKVSFATMSCR